MDQRNEGAYHLHRTRDFAVYQMKGNDQGISTLSLCSNGQLILSQSMDRQSHFYSTDYNHVTFMNVPGIEQLYDALWTPRGKILCTTRVISEKSDYHVIVW